jgi:hypothetical protein
MYLINCLVFTYSENPTDFPLVRFLFTNLVLTDANKHTLNVVHNLPKHKDRMQ